MCAGPLCPFAHLPLKHKQAFTVDIAPPIASADARSASLSFCSSPPGTFPACPSSSKMLISRLLVHKREARSCRAQDASLSEPLLLEMAVHGSLRTSRTQPHTRHPCTGGRLQRRAEGGQDSGGHNNYNACVYHSSAVSLDACAPTQQPPVPCSFLCVHSAENSTACRWTGQPRHACRRHSG